MEELVIVMYFLVLECELCRFVFVERYEYYICLC